MTLQIFTRRTGQLLFAFVRAIFLIPAALFLSCEYSLLLLLHWRSLRNATYLYTAWFWSFGHQTTDLHMLTMRFPGKTLTVFLSDYGNLQYPLLRSFESFLNIIFLHHSPLASLCIQILGVARTRQLKHALITLMMRMVGGKAVLIPDFSERSASIMEGIYMTEYMERMRTQQPSALIPSSTHIASFRGVFRKRFPEHENRWIVSFYFRCKREGSSDVRDTPPTAYRSSIEEVLAKGGVVFCGGDIDPREAFPDLPVMSYRDFSCDQTLTDLYFLTQCLFLVGGHSGPHAIATAFATSMLVTNCPFYYLSGCTGHMRILWKKLKDLRTGQLLAPQKLFSPPVVTFFDGGHFRRAQLEHCDNTSEELLAATKEMIEWRLFKKDFTATSGYQELERKFRALLPRESVVFQSPCKPTFQYLSSLSL